MSEILDDKIMSPDAPLGKIFKEQAILLGTFIGGPIVTGYFIAENYRALDQNHKISKTWIIAILCTILLAVVAIAIPESANFPNQLLPLTYTGIAFGLYKYLQETLVNTFIKNGGQSHSWGRIIIASIIGMIITLGLVIGIGFAWDAIEQQNLVTKKYGTAVVHEIDYYKNNISEAEVDIVANALTEIGFFDEYVEKYILLKKSSNQYILYTSVVQGIQYDTAALEPFVSLQKDLDEKLSENKVVLKLVVDYIDNVVKTIE